MLRQDISPKAILQRGLEKSKLGGQFFQLIIVPGDDPMYDSVTIWGIPMPEDLPKDIVTDQGFEDWKATLGMPDVLQAVKLDSVRHGYYVMSCDSCSADRHLDPIMQRNGAVIPRHIVRTDVIYGELPGGGKESNFLLLTAYGGMFDIYAAPILTRGNVPEGVVFIQPRPFHL
tara:strand:+ start:58 stop:576 length:519 start_codon:yes stop_codon:yes gene_type:complete